MGSPDMQKITDIQVDVANLYQEEMFTDMKVATIRRLTPIKLDGSADESRPTIFSGQTNVLTAAGMLPVSCPIEAANLEEAMAKFPEAAQKAVERMFEELREMQRQEASRIVVPKGGMPQGTPGMPGGGRIVTG